MENKYRRIEYMCRNCGRKTSRGINTGKPLPGVCPRKQNGGPHMWIINRKY